jgi:phenylacetate-CoA ligase
MKKNNIKTFDSLKLIICGAETLYDWQKHFLEDIFKCRISQSYGHAEQAGLANTCEKSNYFHFFPDYGYVEFIGNNGKPVEKENEPCEIVVTGFKNEIFPIIRYKTDDRCVYTTTKCSCNRNFLLTKKIQGRWSSGDFLISDEGRLVSITAMNMHSDVFDNVNQFQFFQDKKGKVIFKIVKQKSYTEKDTKKIEFELQKKLGKGFDLIIEFVKEIPKTPRGKQKFLIQKIPINIWEDQ